MYVGVLNNDKTITKVASYPSNGLQYQVVSSLPISNILSNVRYLIKKTGTENQYTEYQYINNKWSVIGSGSGGEYNLPIASATQLGGIKVGNNLTISNDGVLNAESISKETIENLFK